MTNKFSFEVRLSLVEKVYQSQIAQLQEQVRTLMDTNGLISAQLDGLQEEVEKLKKVVAQQGPTLPL